MPTKKNLAKMRGDTWTLRVVCTDRGKTIDGTCSTAAPTKITSATAAFPTGSVGKRITLAGAGSGGEDYAGLIAARDSATQVTVCPDIGSSVDCAALAYSKPVDITGHVFTLTLKTNLTDTDLTAVLQQIMPAVPAGADATAGITSVIAQIAKTALVAPGKYHWDTQWNRGGSPNVIETPVYGDFTVLADITRTP